jgi:hypothetical protein
MLANMKDQFEVAHLLFAEFQKAFDARSSPGAVWTLDEEDFKDLGLSSEEINRGLRMLVEKGLITRFTAGDDYHLTEEGEEVCLDPELLDGYLSPRR